MASRGKKTPDRNIIGRLMRLATGAAWSSFFAQPATPKPMARKISERQPDDERQDEPRAEHLQPEPDADADEDGDLDVAEHHAAS